MIFSKRGWLIYSSHLDLMRLWERTLRRAGLPLAYSGGYNPRPKLQLARALPLGHVGEREIADYWLETPVSLNDLPELLGSVLPDGLAISEVRQIDEKAPPMQTLVVGTVYRVDVETTVGTDEIQARIEEALSRNELIHERRGKRYNLRPLIEELGAVDVDLEAGRVELHMQLSARPGATGRPEAVLEALGMAGAFARYYRERLVLTEIDAPG